ncbi:hypothetical protein [Legionella septentrionalis]|uniref:Uncharacterized protein n=2 Tax=Legionella septentrionalis TaxID=2498109 RepID=A0A3S0WZ18_9GAMM|nr:hypothetical protein [Legionella septentrionalis]RUQ81006.1 hypothetical protein EKM59_10840 [Legionella septentrionalis]RUQ99358.1 hypothetical protein ELY11_04870 [Legionella septentrionalis]RUR08753.1 hypothetical protein ELY14_10665 [Legionella septentrionalis]RUR13317.1 hypothetical protein ELY10_10565 [Legionella septentrionalis]
MKPVLFFMFMSMCSVSAGATIFIKGLPMALEYRNEVYLLPPAKVISPNTTYLYITMDGVDKICTLNMQTDAVFDQATQVYFLINGARTAWNCHAYQTTVIKVLPW